MSDFVELNELFSSGLWVNRAHVVSVRLVRLNPRHSTTARARVDVSMSDGDVVESRFDTEEEASAYAAAVRGDA